MPGRYSISAESDEGRGGAMGEVGVVPGQIARDVEVLIEPAVSIRGRVEREDGGPCERGLMTLGPAQSGSEVFRDDLGPSKAATDVPELLSLIAEDGSVHFRGATPGVYQAMVRCEDHVLASGPLDVEVKHHAIRGLRWLVRGGAGFRFRVVDQLARPVPHADVALEWTSREGRRLQMPMQTDREGLYLTARAFSTGAYRLLAFGRSEAVALTVERGQTVVEGTLQLEGGGWITVAVSDEAGGPVDGLRVTARAAESTADALSATALGAGRYRLGPMSERAYRVAVDDGVNPVALREAVPVQTVPDPTAASLRLVLSRSGVLRGRVLDVAGNPMANAWVAIRACESQGPSFLPSPRVLTGVAGEFEFTGLRNETPFDITVAPSSAPVFRRRAVPSSKEIELRPEPDDMGGSR